MATALINKWLQAKAAFDAAQALERELRAQVIEAHSTADVMKSGVENCPTFGGIVKITHKLDYNLVNDNDKIDEILDKIEKSQVGGNIIAERLVRWKGELSVTEYKLLGDEQRKLVDAILTIKPASKSVEFVPQK